MIAEVVSEPSHAGVPMLVWDASRGLRLRFFQRLLNQRPDRRGFIANPELECTEVTMGSGVEMPWADRLADDLKEVVDGLDDEIFIVDADYRLRFVNTAVRRRVASDSDLAPGGLCYRVLQGRDAPCSAPLWDCPLQTALRSFKPASLIHSAARADIPVSSSHTEIILYPLQAHPGSPAAAVELRRDVTAERELEAQVLRRHHQLLALNRISSAASGLGDLDAILEVALDTVLETTGGTIGGILLLDERTQKLHHRVQRGLSARFAEELQLSVGEGIAGKVALSGEPMLVQDVSEDTRTARRDLVGAEGLRGLVCVPIKAKNAVLGVIHVASHVPGQFTTEDMYLLGLIGNQLGTAIEQARLYEGISRASERYQTLLQHVLTAQESERKRIARELHDETSQMLTGLALHLQAIIEIASAGDANDTKIVGRLKKAHALAVETSIEITKLINDLRPTLLDSLGLAPAIQRYIETWLEPIGIDASVKTAFSNRLPSEIEVALFRITQEAINNIIKHAEAKHAMIDLECDAEKCTLRIHDDGKGFDTGEITRIDKRGRGVGVFSMKERVALVGGSCAIDSQPGQGTHITVEVPLPGSVKDAEDTSAGSG